MSTEGDDQWSRDLAKMMIAWGIATIVAIIVLLTVIRWYFMAGF